MTALPTLMLNHGAWHTPEYWSLVKSNLEGKGYRCIAPRLLFNDTEKPIDSLAPVIAALQDLIAAETDAGNDVVLVNHSFGGMVGVSAVKGFTAKDPSKLRHDKSGHVLGLVQAPAFTPPSNTSLADTFADPAFAAAASSERRMQHNNEGWVQLLCDPADFFYNDLPREEAEQWIQRLVKYSAGATLSRDSVYAGWLDVPVWYLMCTLDKAITIKQQEMIVQRCRQDGGDVTTKRLQASHSPALSKSGEVAAFVEDAVKAFRAKTRA